MPFTLKVVFSGPCLYVQHPDSQKNTQVAVLMPDARLSSKVTQHWDEEPAEAHVGFIRVNLGDLRGAGLKFPRGTADKPAYELVHQFDREVLTFEGLDAVAMTNDLGNVPDVDEFVTELDLVDELFGADSHKRLVMRTILKGGTLKGDEGKREWRIPRLRSSSTDEYRKKFASFTFWERPVPKDSITLKITAFDGTGETLIPLGPFTANEVVTVEIANLCAFNPLEWDDLPKRQVMGTDEDFKWVYRLLQPRTGSYAKLLKGSALPAPRLVREASRTGDDDCMGAKITREWPIETVAATESGETRDGTTN
jgi:hypothetical protein